MLFKILLFNYKRNPQKHGTLFSDFLWGGGSRYAGRVGQQKLLMWPIWTNRNFFTSMPMLVASTHLEQLLKYVTCGETSKSGILIFKMTDCLYFQPKNRLDLNKNYIKSLWHSVTSIDIFYLNISLSFVKHWLGVK